MKKMFLFAAMASVALASCTTDESVFEGAKANGEKIEFAAANYAAQTRGEHDLGTFTNEDYQVWAINVDENDLAKALIKGVEVEYNSSTNVSTIKGVTNTYYWPNYALDFVATSPYGDPRVALTRAGGVSTVKFTFDGTNANTTKTNLMIADYVSNQTYGVTGVGSASVALKFRHVLANLNVNVNQVNPTPLPTGIKGYNVTVNSLAFNNIQCEGSFTAVEDTYNGATNYIWNLPTTPVKTNWGIITSPRSLEGSPFTTTATKYYVMPQDIANDVELAISYTVTTRFTNDETSVKTFTPTVQLNTILDSSSDPINKWQTNKNVTYTINIQPAALNAISFTVKEEEMGPISGSHTF